MDEQTTTVSDSIDLGDAATSQPSDSIQLDETAAQEPQQTDTNTETMETPEVAEATDENVAWLQNKGIDPSDPDAIAKVAKMYRDAEKAMHEARQPKLNDVLSDQPGTEEVTSDESSLPTDPRVDQLILERNVERFFAAGGDPELAQERKALEPAMSQIVTDNPAIGQMVKDGYMSYDDLAALAKGKDPNFGNSLKQAGGREALEQVAAKQQARAVQGVATTSAVSGDDKADPFLAGFDSVK